MPYNEVYHQGILPSSEATITGSGAKDIATALLDGFSLFSYTNATTGSTQYAMLRTERNYSFDQLISNGVNGLEGGATSADFWITSSIQTISLGGNGFNLANDILGGAGLINGLAGFDAGVSSNHTYRYAKRINGKVVSAVEFTAQNKAKALKVLNASKSIATKLNVASAIVITGDVLYNSQITASQGLNAFMTGIAFTGWGAPVAGLWFVADFGTGLFTGRSLSDRLDSRVGSPLVDWDW